MNTNRLLVAIVGVWIVRVALNASFYTFVFGPRFEEIREAHPGVFRDVIPGYIGTDLIFAVAFAVLFAQAGAALGGGVKAGVKLGLLVAVLSPVIARLYEFFGVTYLPFGLVVFDWVYQVIAHAIEGAVAGVAYKPRAASAT